MLKLERNTNILFNLESNKYIPKGESKKGLSVYKLRNTQTF